MTFGSMQFMKGNYYTNPGMGTVFAEQFNALLMALKGNKILSDCEATVGGQTNMTLTGTHVVIASGEVYIAGKYLSYAGANIDISATFNALTATGKSILILLTIYNNSGTATVRATVAASEADDGDQLPPEYPNDEVPIACLYMTYDDNSISSDNIGDWRIFADDALVLGPNQEFKMYYDGTDIIINHSTAIIYQHSGDSDIELLKIDLANRITTIGDTLDPMSIIWTPTTDNTDINLEAFLGFDSTTPIQILGQLFSDGNDDINVTSVGQFWINSGTGSMGVIYTIPLILRAGQEFTITQVDFFLFDGDSTNKITAIKIHISREGGVINSYTFETADHYTTGLKERSGSVLVPTDALGLTLQFEATTDGGNLVAHGCRVHGFYNDV